LEITSQKQWKQENEKDQKIKREFSHTLTPPFRSKGFNYLNMMSKIIEKTAYVKLFL